ncbi:hypothetical protein HDU77_002559 [Chytriomyces hyalinus]|nr:hypothetical protein HDU77_002559 [Chytriomyces hyalinus]
MESLKTLFELQQMSDRIDMPILNHFFRTFKPLQDKNLKAAIKNFHARSDLESADYRSAYHQLCDWFYGWDVSNAVVVAAAAGGASNVDETDNDLAEDFSLKRVAREIDMAEPGEKVECERIMRTFETLFGLSRRVLKRFHLQLEEMTPRIGQGLATMTSKIDEKEEQEDELKKEDVWKHERNIEADEAAEAAKLEQEAADEGTLGSFEEMRQQSTVDGLIVKKGDVTLGLEGSRRNTTFVAPDSPHSSRSSTPGSEKMHAKSRSNEPRHSVIEKNSAAANSPPVKGFEFSTQTPIHAPEVRRGLLQDGPNSSDAKIGVQRDINLCYTAVNKSLDYLLVCTSNIILVLAFSEILGMKDVFQKYNSAAHELSIDFVSNTLKTVWDLLNRELPDITLAELRDTSLLKQRMKQIVDMNLVKGSKNPRAKVRLLHKKMELVHTFFTAVDIHIFPNFVAAHRDGVKCARFSAFDSNLWLTGGYDCIIRIHDLRPANNHICLSQYVGHKSIVTDVHFTKDDTHIVSCSFDRTIKIWNSQSASCERTLVGHTDSVMSCDVSQDNRFICSGAADNTVRLWDFTTGACVAVIKKHSRWVRIVRFSPDGRFIASAGLDNKIYVWDVKFVSNSKTHTPKRIIEDHRDYVLDLAMARPAYLLTTSRDNTVRMFDINIGCEIYSISLSPSWACTVDFSASGEYFATGSFDNNILIFNSKDGTIVRRIRALNLGIMCVRFPKDLSYVLVGTQEGFVQQIPLN